MRILHPSFTQNNLQSLTFFCTYHKKALPLRARCKIIIMTSLEYTEPGWRRTIDTQRHHRDNNWDYCGRGIYHFTLVAAERYPLFGQLAGTADKPLIQLNEFGRQVLNLLRDEPRYYRERGYALRILASQVMPDHIHVVIQVTEPLPQSIGKVIRGFKSACSSLYKRNYFVSGGKYTAEVHDASIAGIIGC